MSTEARSCTTCSHHPKDAVSIDDAPEICWDCIGCKTADLPYWKPIATEEVDDEQHN